MLLAAPPLRRPHADPYLSSSSAYRARMPCDSPPSGLPGLEFVLNAMKSMCIQGSFSFCRPSPSSVEGEAFAPTNSSKYSAAVIAPPYLGGEWIRRKERIHQNFQKNMC